MSAIEVLHGRARTVATGNPGRDPFLCFSRLRTRLHTVWLENTYPFVDFGKGVSISYSCDIDRRGAHAISLGDEVFLAPDVWLNVEASPGKADPAILLGPGCKIGRRSVISAKNQIQLEADVLLAPSVLIMDHNHEYSDPDLPIHAQGTTAGGKIIIGRNCWLGYGAVICCGRGVLELGHNSIVAANSVVTTSFPPHSVIAGNPARMVKTYDATSHTWVKSDRETARVS